MYVLQNNVDIVSGAKRYCIYDLNTGKIYSLDSGHVKFLKDFIENEKSTEHIPPNIIDYFLESGIVVDKDKLVDKLEPFAGSALIQFAWIEITQNCNLLCRHCYEGSSKVVQKPEMRLECFKLAIDNLKNIGVDRIQLVGGEPLVHTKIEQIIEYVVGKFQFIEIFTNGTLLTDKIFELVEHHGISLAFSVYSEDPALHDYVTLTEGSLESTFRNIELTLSKGIEMRVASIEMKNIPRFQFSNLDVSHRSDLPRLTGRADLSLYTRDMLNRKLITKNSFKRPISPQSYYRNRSIHNCFGERLYIDVDLNVFPCAMERRVSYGNLHSKSIHEMLDSELAKMNKDKIDGCKDCEYRYACYDCRADSNKASINSKPWYCTYNQDEGTWIDEDVFINLLLSDNENEVMA